MSNSYGGAGFSQLDLDSIGKLRTAGALFLAAAGALSGAGCRLRRWAAAPARAQPALTQRPTPRPCCACCPVLLQATSTGQMTRSPATPPATNWTTYSQVRSAAGRLMHARSTGRAAAAAAPAAAHAHRADPPPCPPAHSRVITG